METVIYTKKGEKNPTIQSIHTLTTVSLHCQTSHLTIYPDASCPHNFIPNLIFLRKCYMSRLKWFAKEEMLVIQSCLTLCDSLDYSLPGSSVHGILQARILEWVAIPFSRGSSRPRDRTRVSCIACRFFTVCNHQGSPKWFAKDSHKRDGHCGKGIGSLSVHYGDILESWAGHLLFAFTPPQITPVPSVQLPVIGWTTSLLHFVLWTW